MWLAIHLAIILGLSVRVLLRPHRDPESRIAWILFISALPIVGALAYLMLGEVRLGANAARNLMRAHPPRADSDLEPATSTNALIPECAWAGFSTGESISGFRPKTGNVGHLMENSNTTIDAIAADIDSATDHVHLLFYIWLPDNNGRKIVDAVVRAANRGVTCRVIVDALGSRGFIQSEQWRAMGHAEVRLGKAESIDHILLRILKGRVDVRNHRKIIVIDNRITYCGSQNCADPEFAVKAKFAPWVDAVIRFEDPIVLQNQQLFVSDWLACTGEDAVESLSFESEWPQSGNVIAQVIGTGPGNSHSAMPELFATLMFSARHELIITTPYYVPDEAMQAALCASARRGVATKIVFPASNDSRFVAYASRSYYSDLLAAGVKIYEYKGGLLHTKSLTVDEEMTLIGSANMDRRSFDLNFENNILFADKKLTLQMRERQEQYIANSQLVTMEDVNAWSLGTQLLNNLTAILGPVL